MGHEDADVHIFDEQCILEHVNYNGKIKIAMIGEIPTIYNYAKQFNPTVFDPHDWIKENQSHFDYIMSHFTYFKDMVGESRFVWTHINMSFLKKEEYGIYEKERLLSIIASKKRMTPGHIMRHEVIAQYGSHMDVYGNGYNTYMNDYSPVSKIIALAPYYFTIVILNTVIDDWFDTQTTDALAVGTIPIFRGTKNVGNYFNTDGIIQFDSMEELGRIIPTLSKELYHSKMKAILENMEEAKYYSTTQDWLYTKRKEWLETIKKQ